MKIVNLFILSILLISTSDLTAQEDRKTNHTIVSIGTLPLAHLTLSHDIGTVLEPFKLRASISAIKGVYYNSDDDTPGAITLGAELAFVPRALYSSIDISAGLGVSVIQVNSDKRKGYRYDKFPTVFPRFNLGYRIRGQGNGFVRLGIGYPLNLNLGVGF